MNKLRLTRFNFMLLVWECFKSSCLTPIPTIFRKERGRRKERGKGEKRKEEREGERSWGEVTATGRWAGYLS